MALIFSFSISFFPSSAVAAPKKAPQKPREIKAQAWNLRGSTERLALHNRIADEYGLIPIGKEEAVDEFVRTNNLVAVPEITATYKVVAPERFRFLLPHAYGCLQSFSESYFKNFQKKFKVTELLRDWEYQFFLIFKKKLGSAADCKTWLSCSTHLTGATFDFSKLDPAHKPMTQEELDWVRSELGKLWREKQIDPIEEDHAFHVMCLPPHHSHL